MSSFTRYFKEEFILFIILIAAAMLRFWHYSSFSYSNDELSAIFRTQFGNLNDLIKGGVLTDRHPAGVQIFMWLWIHFFGNSEASVRLPFVIMGIISVGISYLVAKKWFNKMTGLFVAAAITFLTFPLLFSQIARPYGSGLLLSLLTVLCWTELLFPEKPFTQRKKNLVAFAYALSTALCMYNHYFSGLFAIMVGLTGLLFLTKNNIKIYLGALVVSVVLFAPHIPVTLDHLSYKGLGEWLGKPGNDWFWNHLRYIFNGQLYILLMFLLIFLGSIIIGRNSIKLSKFQAIALSWFLIPFIVGFTYSRLINPVLQDTVLIFSFPFLIIFLFSFIQERLTNGKLLILVVFFIVGTTDTIAISKYYKKQHFAEFKELAAQVDTWNRTYGIDQISQVIIVNNPWYINYYLKKLDFQGTIQQYDNRGGKDLLEFQKIVEKSRSPYFIFGWTKWAPEEMTDIIEAKYPFILEQKNYQGLSAVTLYGRTCKTGFCNQTNPYLDVTNNFSGGDLWGFDPNSITNETSHSAPASVVLDNTHEFGPLYSFKAGDSLDRIRTSVWAMVPEDSCDAQIVISIEDVKGKARYWVSSNFNNFNVFHRWNQVFFNYPVPKDLDPSDIIKIYVWNNRLKKVLVDDFRIRLYSKTHAQ